MHFYWLQEIALGLLVVWITLVDIRFHKITNRSNSLLALLLLFDLNPATLTQTLSALVLAFILVPILKIGMGDLKLWTILVITNGKLILTVEYFNGICIALLFLTLFTLVQRKGLQGAVPMAPVLLAPFLFLYLEI